MLKKPEAILSQNPKSSETSKYKNSGARRTGIRGYWGKPRGQYKKSVLDKQVEHMTFGGYYKAQSWSSAKSAIDQYWSST